VKTALVLFSTLKTVMQPSFHNRTFGIPRAASQDKTQVSMTSFFEHLNPPFQKDLRDNYQWARYLSPCQISKLQDWFSIFFP